MTAPGAARNLTAAPVDEPTYVRTDCFDLPTWPLHTIQGTNGVGDLIRHCRPGHGCKDRRAWTDAR
mgnify:CR=1 FL=1